MFFFSKNCKSRNNALIWCSQIQIPNWSLVNMYADLLRLFCRNLRIVQALKVWGYLTSKCFLD